jgi:UDP-N-acetylmuramyl pentapeptide synthase
MKYGPRDIAAMLTTPVGRIQFREGIAYQMWPLVARAARAWRRVAVRRTRVIAVVGSFGKSTTTRAVAAALALPVHPKMLANAYTSLAQAVLRVRPGQERAVIEVGISAPGQMAAYARVVCPDVVVVTGIGSEHRRSLGTLEVTRAEKSLMAAALPASGLVVLNGDDPNVMWMRGLTAARAITYGFGDDCDVRASAPRLDWPHGMRFTLDAFGMRREVAIALIGRHMIYPVLAAVAVAGSEGVPLDDALLRLVALPPTTGRMQPVSLPNGVMVLRDDFKSAVETMHAALAALAEIPARRRVVVLGDVTDPPAGARALYRELGTAAAGIATHLVTIGQAAELYATAARIAGMPPSAIHDAGNSPRQAADVLARLLEPGDVLLIKGRGTQMLDRVRLILAGREVRCDIDYCNLRRTECESCPMLERGWEGKRRVR